jgi:hypothetical protein
MVWSKTPVPTEAFSRVAVAALLGEPRRQALEIRGHRAERRDLVRTVGRDQAGARHHAVAMHIETGATGMQDVQGHLQLPGRGGGRRHPQSYTRFIRRGSASAGGTTDMSAPTHYLILVHGTWARRKDEEAVWYVADESSDNFCRRLETLLRGTDLEGAIWRHCEGVEWPFLWSGDNTHHARLEGAAQLCSRLKTIVKTDRSAMIHIVAHSHGGNVTLAAIDRYLEEIDFQARTIYSSLRLLKSKLDRPQREETRIKPFILSDTWSAPVSDWDSGVKEILRANCRERAHEALEVHGSLIEEIRFENERHELKVRLNPWKQWWDEARPPVDQRAERFVARWKGNSEWTRLGRIVFMGTPFLRKTWRLRPRVAYKVAAALPFAFLGTLYFPGILIIPVLVVYLLITWPGWNPLEWSSVVQLLLVFWLVGGVVGWLPRTTMGTRSDTNVYFKNYAPYAGMHNQECVGHSVDPPLRALTVHAGPLDEALLALSSEPIVYGSLLPVIEHRVFAGPQRLHDVVGTTSSPVEWTRSSLQIAQFGIRKFVHVATERPLRPIRRLVMRRMTDMLCNIVSSRAFGLYPEEFEHARIQASWSANVPEAMDETSWDVSRHLSEAPPIDTSARAAREVSERYKFLWDRNELEKKAEASAMWKQVSVRMQSIGKRYPEETLDRLSSTLMRTCIMLEEKQREIGGSVSLTHSTYYTSEDVIRGVARFITTAKGPIGGH